MSLIDLENILSNSIGGKKILGSSITSLVAPGENFGGELLRVDVTVRDERTDEVDVIHAVAKKIPQMEMFQKLFDIQNTFRAEINFYEKIVPLLQQFQNENGVQDVADIFAKMYGSRINLNGSDTVDKDAAIIIENLTVSGYRNVDRFVGYDLEEAKILLKDLAALHAVPLAIKIKNPVTFENELRPLLNTKFPLPAASDSNMMTSKMFNVISEILYESDKCAIAIPKVKKAWDKFYELMKYDPVEPFATLCHADLWVNNAMMKYENGKPIKNKFVDFQLYDYKSPAIDLMNFIFTSVSTEVLKEHFEALLKFYHTHFIDNLKRLQCDTKSFEYEEFLKELHRDCYMALAWTLTFIPFVIYGPKGQTANPALDDLEGWKLVDEIRKNVPQRAKEKLQFIVEYTAKNNLI